MIDRTCLNIPWMVLLFAVNHQVGTLISLIYFLLAVYCLSGIKKMKVITECMPFG